MSKTTDSIFDDSILDVITASFERDKEELSRFFDDVRDLSIDLAFDNSVLDNINASFKPGKDELSKALNDMCWASLAVADIEMAIATGPCSYKSLTKLLNTRRHKTPLNEDWTPEAVEHLCALYDLKPSLQHQEAIT